MVAGRLGRSDRGSCLESERGKMAGGFRFLSLVQPFMSVLPEVAQAERKIPFR